MPKLTRIALYSLIVSVVISAVLGIGAILSNNWGDTEIKILLTTLTTSGASICGLACAALWERKRTVPLPVLGIALTVLGAALMLAAIWAEASNTDYLKFTITLILFAIATAHLSLLSLAKLSARFQWAILVAYASIYGLAAILSGMIWTEDTSTGAFQCLGVTAIIVAGISILIPIFHKLSTAADPGPDQNRLVKVLCPCCGAEQEHRLGEITCSNCQCVFVMRIISRNTVPAP